jgi:membrane protein insertase Oxa1/YidC/SpoIIIJ
MEEVNQWLVAVVAILGIINMLIIGPALWLYRSMREMKAEIAHVRATRPNREEMKEYVTLAQRPTEVLLQQMQGQLETLINLQLERGNGRDKS